MSVEGDICAFVRGRKNKKKAIKIAAEIYAVTQERVRAILWANHLSDEYGEWIEPIRLTGIKPTTKRRKRNGNSY